MQTIKQLPRHKPEPTPVFVPQPVRVLFCATCDTWTPHVLNSLQSEYTCGCGDVIEYHINVNPHLWGVR